jgi:glycosyltransferase involved in cell wall biosynthesis
MAACPSRAPSVAAGVPVILYFRNVEMEELGGDPASVGAAACIANSRFTAQAYRDAFGLHATVIPPTIDARRYRVTSDRSAVVFINPVAEKGLDRAIGIAAQCPDIPFLFVESWRLSPAARRGAFRADRALSQHHLHPAQVDDMRQVYARARFLLAPSLWQEAWGRVASEAQCSGLPVIGSDRGGLPEAIGPGGVIIPAEADLAGWVAAVRRLWSDRRHYDEMSAQARLHAERPEIDPEVQFRTFLDVITGAASREGRVDVTSARCGGASPSSFPTTSAIPASCPRARQRARAGASARAAPACLRGG